MPTYEYRCKDCGHKFDVFHQMNDTSERKCPECEGASEKMIGTGSGIIFKGPGFHATDYAKPKCADNAGSCPSGTCCRND